MLKNIERMTTFLDTINTGAPVFFTENRITHETSVLIMREFRKEGAGDPIVIVPPQAAHHSSIADFDNNQSLVQTALQSSDAPVYCIDWKSATQECKNTSIGDLVEEILGAWPIDGPCHLVGLCMGGWVAAIFTSRHQDLVSKLTIAGSPIDSHIDGGDIQEIVQKIPHSFYEMIVGMNGGIMSGDMMLLGWKSGNAMDRYVIDYMKLWNATDNPEKVRKIKQFRTWYEHTRDLAGSWYLQVVDDLFRKNLLVKGEMIVGGEPVDLSKITCPVNMVTGSEDEITPHRQCTALGDLISTPKEYKKVVDIHDAGHIALFMGTKSQSVWAENIF